MRRAIGVTLVLLLVVGAAGYAWYRRPKPVSTSTETSRYTVARDSIFQAVTCTGRVLSKLDVDVKAKVGGQIIALPFDISQSVHQGDVLVELDPIIQQRLVKQAEVGLRESQAKLGQTERNVAIAESTLSTSRSRVEASIRSAEVRARDMQTKAALRKQLLDENLGSQEEYNTVEMEAARAAEELEDARIRSEELKAQEIALEIKRNDVAIAHAEVEADELALSNAQQQLKDTKIYATMDGVVAALNVRIGSIVSSGLTNVGGGTTLMVLSDLTQLFVLASVDESDIGNVAVGQPATITADAYPGRRFDGRVVIIAPRGNVISNVVTFDVEVEVLDEHKSLLKPEMTVNIQIVSAQRDDVIVVPSQALERKGNKNVVTVVKADGATEERPVKIGLTDGERFELTGGLSEGEIVVLHKEGTQSRWNANQARPISRSLPAPSTSRSSASGRR